MPYSLISVLNWFRGEQGRAPHVSGTSDRDMQGPLFAPVRISALYTPCIHASLLPCVPKKFYT